MHDFQSKMRSGFLYRFSGIDLWASF